MSLNNATSPFLLSHKDSPVQWRTWGPEALAEAKKAGQAHPALHGLCRLPLVPCDQPRKLLQCRRSPRLINDNFIPILADREERPDLDMLYQGAAGIMQHPGGWPLNIFLTPDGAALVGDRLSAADRPARQSQLPQVVARLRRAVEERPRPRRRHGRQGHQRRWSISTTAT